MNSDLIGTRLGKYEIQAEIGRGGMGAVYRGYDPALDRYVAVKVLAPHLVWEKEFVERFLREARAAARLKHAGIVTIHDVGQEGDWYYFIMEYLEGQTLTEVIRQRGPLSSDEALSILRPLAAALNYAHHRGLVHRHQAGQRHRGPGGAGDADGLRDCAGSPGDAADGDGSAGGDAGVHEPGAGEGADGGCPQRPVQPGGGGL